MKRLDPTLADEPHAISSHLSNRYCHRSDSGVTNDGALTFTSECGYPAIGWVDEVTACQRHYDAARQ